MIISPLSRIDFEDARIKLQQQGITISGDQGSVEGHKVRVDFFYDGVNNLTLNIEHKPWYYPEQEVEDEIRKWFNK